MSSKCVSIANLDVKSAINFGAKNDWKGNNPKLCWLNGRPPKIQLNIPSKPLQCPFSASNFGEDAGEVKDKHSFVIKVTPDIKEKLDEIQAHICTQAQARQQDSKADPLFPKNTPIPFVPPMVQPLVVERDNGELHFKVKVSLNRTKVKLVDSNNMFKDVSSSYLRDRANFPNEAQIIVIQPSFFWFQTKSWGLGFNVTDIFFSDQSDNDDNVVEQLDWGTAPVPVRSKRSAPEDREDNNEPPLKKPHNEEEEGSQSILLMGAGTSESS